ncbi:PREDICTED: serine palmitoyltransferase small subunit A [Tinamus guttatus]|nr:PREDICTED: serine palmitoyltransferase small subunit A [Tinamus guttatus]
MFGVFQVDILDCLHEDSLLVSIVGMALYTGYVFMPQHIMAILHYFEIVQ